MTESAKERINVFWFLPTHGDGRYLGTAQGGRPVDLPYLQQVALAADNLGYYGVLIPTGKSCEDSWLVAAALAPLTRRLRYLVAVRPGLQPPSLAARMAATLDRLSDGRLLINVVTGGDPVENKGMASSQPCRTLRGDTGISHGVSTAAARGEGGFQR